jgi:DNA-3-methyladenine glycosylase I (EC 3.2.2.20)
MPDSELTKALENPGIIRNKLKVASTVQNAKAFLAIQNEFGSFSTYLWAFVDGKPIQNYWASMKEVPAKTALSDKLSKDLKNEVLTLLAAPLSTHICKHVDWLMII